MRISYITKIIPILIIIPFMLNANFANAAWWEMDNIPLPSGTEEAHKETRKIAGSEFVLTYYASTQDTVSIKAFYRTKLTTMGWKESSLTEDLKQIPSFKDISSLSNLMGQNLIFEKDDEMIIINFLPQQTIQDGKSRFTIGRGKFNPQQGQDQASEEDYVPELLTKPKKNIAPVYPGSSLINLSEQNNAYQATYFTKDDISQAISFYKTKMSGYNWQLIEEKPLERLDYGDLNKYDVSQDCPHCPKVAIVSPKSIQTWVGQLVFSNTRKDSCKIIFSKTVSAETGSLADLTGTTILVSYEEK